MKNTKLLHNFYYKCKLIRNVEESIEYLFSQGKLFGTTHSCIGQEIVAVSVLSGIDITKDTVTGTHRSHGHYLALFDDPESLFAELMGKRIAFSQGKGGSQHLYRDNFYTNGITGGMIPIATGIALSKKLNNSDAIVVAFLGDGAMNEGYVFESFNFASIKQIPILFVLENNLYAMSTHVNKSSAGNFNKRIESLNIKNFIIDSSDYNEINNITTRAIEYVRTNKIPAFVHFITYRYCGHSKNDTCEYRSSDEENFWKERDILKRMENEIDFEVKKEIENRIKTIINKSIKNAEKAKWPDPYEVYKY